MSQDQHLAYQIIATRRGQEDGSARRARLGYRPFLIGSGSGADLRLDSPAVSPVHARLFLTTTGQVMITNLGLPGTLTLDGDPIAPFKCAHWKPGALVQLGDYDLQLVTLVVEDADGQREYVRPSVITQESEPVDPFQSMLAGDEPATGPPPAPARPFWSDEDDEVGERVAEAVDAPSAPSEAVSPPAPPRAITDTPVVPFTPDAFPPPPAPPAAGGAAPAAPIAKTLPKDWLSAGPLSAQVAINPVNLVAGERVRVPISARNGHSQDLQLRVSVAGLPREWVILPEAPPTLVPGEIGAFDLILQTPPAVPVDHLEAAVHLTDRAAPELSLVLPLRLNFKPAPDLVGRLASANVDFSRQTCLYLHNHTQAAAEVFIAGHTDAPGLEVIPAQTQATLPPGQMVKIPVIFTVARRPWLRPARYAFSLSAVQGSRAPLDYPGTVRVRPRLSILPLALLLILALTLAAGVYAVRHGLLSGAPPGTPTATALPTGPAAPSGSPSAVFALPATATAPPPTRQPPTPTPTVPTLTPTATSTPTLTPSPTPSATPTPPYVDPRPEGCAAVVPPGWEPHLVRRGDTAYRLAVTLGTTVDTIAAVNCLADPNHLREGQALLLPPAP